MHCPIRSYEESRGKGQRKGLQKRSEEKSKRFSGKNILVLKGVRGIKNEEEDVSVRCEKKLLPGIVAQKTTY